MDAGSGDNLNAPFAVFHRGVPPWHRTMVVGCFMSSVGSRQSTDGRRKPEMDTNVAQLQLSSDVRGLYDRLEDRCLMRDQKGASDVYYELVRAGRPLNEIVAQGVRIHAPYTHVPYHERMDDGYPNFVNNDHCLLSARATINLNRMLPAHLAMLPMAQTIWYIPTGLDIWNQKIDKAPGHYTRHRGNSQVEEK